MILLHYGSPLNQAERSPTATAQVRPSSNFDINLEVQDTAEDKTAADFTSPGLSMQTALQVELLDASQFYSSTEKDHSGPDSTMINETMINDIERPAARMMILRSLVRIGCQL